MVYAIAGVTFVAKTMSGSAVASIALTAALVCAPSVAPAQTRARPGNPPEGDVFTEVFWFAVRGFGHSRDMGDLTFEDDDTAVGTGRDLGLGRRTHAGFELTGGAVAGPVYVRLGFGAAWDAEGPAMTRVSWGGAPTTLRTTGVASAGTLAAGVRPRLRGSVLTAGAFLAYTVVSARLDTRGDPLEVAATRWLYGLELGVEQRVARTVALSITARTTLDLDVFLAVGLAFGADRQFR